MKKIPSGVIGFNPLLHGGINERSVTVVIGASGIGKTTFATEFLRRGVEAGDDGLFVTMDENRDQIILEAEEMGWKDIYDYIDDRKLIFLDVGGRKFSDFIRTELPAFVEEYAGQNARISIDPLTPVIWAVKDRYEQRELLSLMFNELRKVGTVVCTLEEHSVEGRLTGEEITIPMYLADCVAHLRYVHPPHMTGRDIQVIKCRNSAHSRGIYPFRIVKGLGIVVEPGKVPGRKEAKGTAKAREAVLKEIAKCPPTLKARAETAISHLAELGVGEKDISRVISLLLADYGE